MTDLDKSINALKQSCDTLKQTADEMDRYSKNLSVQQINLCKKMADLFDRADREIANLYGSPEQHPELNELTHIFEQESEVLIQLVESCKLNLAQFVLVKKFLGQLRDIFGKMLEPVFRQYYNLRGTKGGSATELS